MTEQSNLAAAMRESEAESERNALRLIAKELRDYLAGALCAACGDPLGHDEELVQDDDDRTMHKRCDDEAQA